LAADEPKSEKSESAPALAKPEKSEAPAAATAIAAPPPRRAEVAPARAEAVIPLLPVPDDPGPDAEPVEDNEPHAPPQDNGGWRRIFG
jgi:hypothetical protein